VVGVVSKKKVFREVDGTDLKIRKRRELIDLICGLSGCTLVKIKMNSVYEACGPLSSFKTIVFQRVHFIRP